MIQNIAILDYGAGNIQSLSFALERLGIKVVITSDIDVLSKVDKIIFPGQGEASNAMKQIKEKSLDVFIQNYKKPFLGICLGMQLLCKESEENNTQGLGIFDTKVEKFSTTDKVFKIPQMGWNQILDLKGALFKDCKEKDYVYFAHSYFVEENDFSTAKTDYIVSISAAFEKDNFFGVQFHPEKSSKVGAQVLKNFIEL
jgi:imidazole glycerol-phosphate synthase subunit HisH